VAFKAGNVSTPMGEDFIGNLWRKKVRRRRGEEIIAVLLNDNERAATGNFSREQASFKAT
jgi:hypothetical protein